ncbi:MAG: glycosyltransferase [Patescibacteria group bacterium]
MTICAIILTVNNYALLKKSLTSLYQTHFPQLKIFVFDNGSTVNLLNKLRRDFPQVEVWREEKNLGFAEGNNRAIVATLLRYRPDYFLLFNNDALAHPDLFKVCLPYLKQGVDLLSPTILLSGGRGIDNVGIDYFRSGYAHSRLLPHNPAQLPSGCCLFISRAFVRKNLKLFGWVFNPLFFSYAEDLELGLRAKLFGAQTRVLDSALVTHRRLGTLGEANLFRHFVSWRNLLWTVITTWPRATIRRNFGYILWGQLVINALYLWDGKFWLFPRIYLSTLKHLKELLATRRKIMAAVCRPQALEQVFVGDIARWSIFLKGRKLYRMGRALKSVYGYFKNRL